MRKFSEDKERERQILGQLISYMHEYRMDSYDLIITKEDGLLYTVEKNLSCELESSDTEAWSVGYSGKLKFYIGEN